MEDGTPNSMGLRSRHQPVSRVPWFASREAGFEHAVAQVRIAHALNCR